MASEAFARARAALSEEPRSWLVTGAGGFVGSNLVEALLGAGQTVRGLDDFSTGYERNVQDAVARAEESASGRNGAGVADRFDFIEGDICDLDACRRACEGVDYVLHQAALGSVPRSIERPTATNAANVDGFLNVIVAARDAGVRRFVYASSSSVYGDDEHLPKVEQHTGTPLSPYAVTKQTGELYAHIFQHQYGLQTVGLRYFNVFGRRQDPDGAYSAVVPRWIGRLLDGEVCHINGDGETSRDFSYIANVVQANILAARADEDATDEVYNVGCDAQTTLNELYDLLRDELVRFNSSVEGLAPEHRGFRAGDVRHSRACIDKAVRQLGYQPTHDVREGLRSTVEWYAREYDASGVASSPS